MKSSVDEIRRRFDEDVERFSNLDTGQTSTIDAALAMELVAVAAASTNPDARRLLDVGCGAGNYSLKLLERVPGLDVTLVDLSLPMLERAEQRLRTSSAGAVTSMQGDIRELQLEAGAFDIIVAASVLHHLRADDEWRATFHKLHDALAPGGSLWVFDLVESGVPAVQDLMWQRYGEYLESFRDSAYRDHVFEYVAREDSPRPLMFQLDLMRDVGFQVMDVLHKNGPFAAFGGIRA